MKKKKYIYIFMFIIILLSSTLVQASQLIVENKEVDFDITPDKITEDSYFPLENLKEKFDIEVDTLQSNRYIIFYNNNFFIITVGSQQINTDNGKYNLKTTPIKINDHLLIPVEFLTRFMGLNIRVTDSKIPIGVEESELKSNIYINKTEFDKYDTLEIIIEVINSTDQDITLEFSSSKKYEILIKNRFGNTVYTWSKNKRFAQAFTELEIDAKDAQHFEEKINLSGFSEGVYYVEAIIESTNIKMNTGRRRFEIDD